MSDNGHTQRDVNLEFIASKGFDVSTLTGLRSARQWLENADADELMYGEPSGDPFDIFVGSMRRGMLIKSVDAELKRLTVS